MSVLPAILSFFLSFAGGLATGFLAARLAVRLLVWLRELRLAQVMRLEGAVETEPSGWRR